MDLTVLLGLLCLCGDCGEVSSGAVTVARASSRLQREWRRRRRDSGHALCPSHPSDSSSYSTNLMIAHRGHPGLSFNVNGSNNGLTMAR